MSEIRPRRPKIVLVAAWLLSAAAAVSACKSAAGAYFALKAPALALQIDPGNALALGRAFATLQSQSGGKAPLSMVDRRRLLASVQKEPTAKQGLAVLGRDADARNDPKASEIMHLVEKISRREPATQIWLAGESGRQSDLKGLMRRYDRALSVAIGTSSVLFPALTKALATPQIDDHLVPLIRRDPPWADDFIIYATSKAERAEYLARILRKVGPLPKSLRLPVIPKQILDRFVADGDIRGARAFAVDIMGAPSSAVEQLVASTATTDERFTPLTWKLSKGNAIVSAFMNEGGVEILTPPNEEGAVLERTLYLPGGSYTLTSRVRYPDGPPAVKLRWSAACLKGSRRSEFWQETIPAAERESQIEKNIAVPNLCSGVELTLFVESVSERDRSLATIDEISLRPAS